MNLSRQKTSAIFSILLIFSIFFGNLPAPAQDIVGSEDISAGTSVFIFRQSKTKPQFKSHSDKYFLRNIAGRGTASRRQSQRKINFNSRLAGQTKNKRDNAGTAKKDPSDTLTAKANTLLKNKATDKAILTFQEALRKDPQNRNARLGLSRAYSAKGNEIFEAEDKKTIGEAIDFYEKALAIEPDSPGLSLQIANINYQKGDIAKAENYLSRAEKTAGSIAEIELLRGIIHLKQNENQAALVAFGRSLKLDPKNADAYFYQAEALDRLNFRDEAIKAYRQTVALDPQFTEAWFDLAVLSYNTGGFKEAIAFYREVIARDNDHPDAHANLASAYRQLEKYAEANGEYKIAAQYLKNDPDLFSEWGYCLGKVAEWDKAIARLQAAKDFSPQALDYTNLGWAYLNAAQKDSGNKDEAGARAKFALGKEALQKAIGLDPKFEPAYLNLGVILTRSGEYQNAVSILNKANNLRQNWLPAITQLGLAYRSFNKLPEAINQFQKAISLDERFAPGYFYMGEAQFRNGKKKEARKTMGKLKQLNPELAKRLEDIITGPGREDTYY